VSQADPSTRTSLAAAQPAADAFGRPLRVLRLSVTDRCNLRCGYCMPEQSYTWLPRSELLDFDELSRVVDRFAEVGVERVRLTGGEPLLRRDLPLLVECIATKPSIREVALTTNGIRLSEHATALAAAGLSRLTVSLDTLRPDRFRELTRYDALADVLAGIASAVAAGYGGRAEGPTRLKLDTVVLRGVNDDELVDLLDFAGDHGAEVRFIEYMDVGGATRWDPRAVVSRADMLAYLEARCGTPEPLAGRGSAPAERFRLPDGRCFGIIASTTAPFCKDCDRSRLTADGMWLHCLYAERGVDLKTPLRAGLDDEALTELLRTHWGARDARGAETRASMAERGALIPVDALRNNPHLEMHTRGG
jgi:cyclic pyranopterin phosphate synthase